MPPKFYVVDCGVGDQLNNVSRKGNDFDMEQVEAIMNHKVINEVVTEWIERAEGQDCCVCSTVKHAEDLLESFVEHNIDAKLVTGGTPKDERAKLYMTCLW